MNFKRTLLVFIILTSAYTGKSQVFSDYNITVNKFKGFYNQQQGDSIFNMFSEKLKIAIPLNKTVEKFTQLHSKIGNMVSFQFLYEKDGMCFYTTEFTKAILSLAVTLNRNIKFETFRFLPYQIDTAKFELPNFFLSTPTGVLYGTLATPPGLRKVPVVLIIPGLGPTDRNGNNPYGVTANTYRMIADSLVKEGIASLRFDKRGVALSASALSNEDSLTFDDMVNDATGFTKLLKQHWRFTKVIILGHGEGSLIGMRVAEKEKVDGYISVAGVGQRADKIIEQQLRKQSKELSTKATVIFDSLINGYTVNDIDPSFNPVFRLSAQGYIRSWLKYDPQDEIKKLNIPILILQGTTDIEVKVKEAKRLHKASPESTFTLIEGMNYVLKQAPKDNVQNAATYFNPDMPLSPGLIPAITTFIRGIK